MAARIGDVFKVLALSKPFYFQLIGIDEVELGSSVIAVFSVESMTKDAKVEDIVRQPLMFYTHTTVTDGIQDGLWEKVGHTDVQLDLESIVFKSYHGLDEKEITEAMNDTSMMPPIPYPNWTVWRLGDEEWRFIGLEEGLNMDVESSGTVPADDIIYRLKHGRSEFPADWLDDSMNDFKEEKDV